MPPDSKPEPDRGMPRWVKVFAAIGIILVAVFLVVHLAGGGMHGHHQGP